MSLSIENYNLIDNAILQVPTVNTFWVKTKIVG